MLKPYPAILPCPETLHDASGRALMRRWRSVNLALMRNASPLAIVLPLGSLSRILYLAHDSECSRRVTSSSGRFSRSFTSAYVSVSSPPPSARRARPLVSASLLRTAC